MTLAVIGVALISLTSISGSGFNPLAIPFALWSAVPCVVLWAAGRVVRDLCG